MRPTTAAHGAGSPRATTIAVRVLMRAEPADPANPEAKPAIWARPMEPKCPSIRSLRSSTADLPGLFVSKQSRRTCPDLGEAKPGVSVPHLRKRSEWVALSRPGSEHVGPRFGPRGPLWRGGGLPMTLRDQRAFAICLGGCGPGAQSCCPRSARDDELTDPDNGPDAVRHARSPADYRRCAAERRCGPLFGDQ
jgi:hypothetical protein